MLRLQAERVRRKMSRAALARNARIDQSTYSKIENGRVQPYPPELRRLARALGFPCNEAEHLLEDAADLS